MAMKVNGNDSSYSTDYVEQLRAKQHERADEAKKEETRKASSEIPEPRDEYIKSEEADRKPSGLYRLGQDKDGNPKVYYDDPKKPANTDKEQDVKESEEICVGDTGRVDREIKNLKAKKQELEQQISKASGDEKKVKELEAELAQVESALSQKDNDTYRKQNTEFTS